jgi:hypothetical protein
MLAFSRCLVWREIRMQYTIAAPAIAAPRTQPMTVPAMAPLEKCGVGGGLTVDVAAADVGEALVTVLAVEAALLVESEVARSSVIVDAALSMVV